MSFIETYLSNIYFRMSFIFVTGHTTFVHIMFYEYAV